MRRLLLLAPLAFAVPLPASAAPICEHVTLDVAPLGTPAVAYQCVPVGYAGPVHCAFADQGTGPVRAYVMLCLP